MAQGLGGAARLGATLGLLAAACGGARYAPPPAAMVSEPTGAAAIPDDAPAAGDEASGAARFELEVTPVRAGDGWALEVRVHARAEGGGTWRFRGAPMPRLAGLRTDPEGVGFPFEDGCRQVWGDAVVTLDRAHPRTFVARFGMEPEDTLHPNERVTVAVAFCEVEGPDGRIGPQALGRAELRVSERGRPTAVILAR